MEIQKYNKDNFPFEYLDAFVDLQIECWGQEPFGEFMLCSSKECGKSYSIEDIYGDINNYSSEEHIDMCCSGCGEKLEYFYPKEDFKKEIVEYIKGNVELILLLDNQKNVSGFGVYNKKELKELFEFEFALRPMSYNLDCLKKIFSKQGYTSNQKVNLIHHIYVNNKNRGRGYGKIIYENMIKSSDKKLPYVLETKYSGDFYPETRKNGYENISQDKYGYVLQLKKGKKITKTKNYYQEEAKKIIEKNFYFPYSKLFVNAI